MFRSEADAGAVGEPQPASRGLSPRHRQALGPPDALDTLGVDLPAGALEQRRDATVAVAAEGARQGDDRCREGVLVEAHLRLVTLASTYLQK